MTITQWQKEMRNKAKKCPLKAYGIGVRDAVSSSAVRIFEKGKGFSGSIGSYNSTDPVYVALKNSPKKFRVKSGRKGRVFKSYKDFRQSIGRNTAFVNLRLSNELYNDYSNTKISSRTRKTTGLTPAKPIKINNKQYLIVLSKQINIDKMRGMEDHFKTEIFGVTKKEIKKMNKVIEFEMARCYDKSN